MYTKFYRYKLRNNIMMYTPKKGDLIKIKAKLKYVYDDDEKLVFHLCYIDPVDNKIDRSVHETVVAIFVERNIYESEKTKAIEDTILIDEKTYIVDFEVNNKQLITYEKMSK
jgi:hypothetical protein